MLWIFLPSWVSLNPAFGYVETTKGHSYAGKRVNRFSNIFESFSV